VYARRRTNWERKRWRRTSITCISTIGSKPTTTAVFWLTILIQMRFQIAVALVYFLLPNDYLEYDRSVVLIPTSLMATVLVIFLRL